MSLPRDLDLTTLSDTYLTAMLEDQRKQDDEYARQMNEIAVRRSTITDVRGKLQDELKRRHTEDTTFYKPGQVVCRNVDGRTAIVIYDSFDGYVYVERDPGQRVWWAKGTFA